MKHFSNIINPGALLDLAGTARIFLLAVLTLLFIFPTSIRAQLSTRDFDYDHYPTLDYDIQRLELDLDIASRPLHLDGIAQYVVSPRIDSLQTIRMHAVRLDIQQVQVKDQQSNFEVSGDTLLISLSEPAYRDEEFSITIRYRATPDFGILRDTSGTVWTSRLPRSNAHWIPVFDHPRVEFKTNLHYSVPPDYTVISNGSFVKENVVSVDKKQFHFESNRPISASELSFVAGPLIEEKASFGVKMIRGYFLPGTLTGKQRQNLLDTAYRTLNRSEDSLQHEYPYSAFNFVVLPDHHWETKLYASSMGFIYRNGGDLSAQLNRTILAQWYGSYQREEQWSDAEGILLHQAWLHSKMNAGEEGKIIRSEAPDTAGYHFYDVFGGEHWNRWQNFYDHPTRRPMKRVIDRTARKMLNVGGGVYNWDDYARLWYDFSGQPRFDVPILPGKVVSDTSRYRAKTYYNSSEGRLAIKFTAVDHPRNELVTLPLIQVRADSTVRKSVTFTGKSDSVVFKNEAGLQNIYIENDLELPVKVDLQKPKAFWIHQLRNAESPGDRARGARELKAYSDDPDLQLLLNQVRKQDSSVKVQAAVYSTLGAILRGAAGTAKTFLSGLRSGHVPIQKEALSALIHYGDEPRVKNEIRRFALEQQNPDMVRSAVEAYAGMADTTEFESFAREFVARDTTATGLPTVLGEWVKRTDSEEPLKIALDYTGYEYTFKTRSRMITLLIEHGQEYGDWVNKIPELLQDLDPRIRYITVEALSLLPAQRAREAAAEQRDVEYDARVVEKLNSFIH